MGCPVQSFRKFEEHVSSSYNNKDFTIVLLANAVAPSTATKFVVNNFNRLDFDSDDVNFYLPGYGIGLYANEFIPAKEWAIRAWEEESKREFRDQHAEWIRRSSNHSILFGLPGFWGSRSPIKVIESERLGKILFNPMEYADFVRNLSTRLWRFPYMGGCAMVVLPKDARNFPDYETAGFYLLDLLVGHKDDIDRLEIFIYHVFEIIRENVRKKSKIIDLFTDKRRKEFITKVLGEIKYWHNEFCDEDKLIKF